MPDNLIPISDAQAELGTEIVKALRGLGGYFKDIAGSMPEDLIGFFGADALHAYRTRRQIERAENLTEVVKKVHTRLTARGVESSKPIPLAIGGPILEAAADEGRAELQDLWARLLATAMDPGRSDTMRMEFIETVKQMNPIDAAVLEKLGGANYSPNARDFIASQLKCSSDRIEVSISHLTGLGCAAAHLSTPENAYPTAYGRELKRALQD
ncbi:MAG: Abi-alpha family protein [Parvibaculum sp.]|uniref:Abi-alpha family protein n=1 Tax=Parvibaculum sp. TaxID=2024848 RepID=UPI0028439B12|nr:Abi-alpha family protein [Parvibaculum sp.]MDR3500918.1 Abi-alpha family protein [Parvibaculum sp.]